MNKHYEKPEAEVISFQAQEQLAVVNDEIKDSEAGWKSKDF